MKKILIAAIAALALPASAVAADDTSASAACKAQRTTLGVTAFKDLHGTNKNKANAFGKCVSKQQKLEAAARTEAKSTCKAEQAMSDEDFAAAHGGKTFTQFYGTNKNGANAYGKCVSTQAKAKVEESREDTLNAAKTCKKQRKEDSAGFATQWGTKKNAYGKCVSATAKAQNDDETTS